MNNYYSQTISSFLVFSLLKQESEKYYKTYIVSAYTICKTMLQHSHKIWHL